MARLVLLICAALIAAGTPTDSNAIEPTSKSIKGVAQRAKESRPAAKVNPELEAAAHALVASHLPELKEYLARLRSKDAKQYERAITSLGRSAKRLETTKNRDPRLFEIEVETLKAQNAVDLLTAKLKVRDKKEDRNKLRAAVEHLQHWQITRNEYDISVLQARLERTQKQLDASKQRLQNKRSNLEEQVEKHYVGMLRKAGRSEPSRAKAQEAKSDAKPAEKKRPAERRTPARPKTNS